MFEISKCLPVVIMGKVRTVLDFLQVCKCSYFNYSLEGGVVHNLFIASASKELKIVPLRPPSSNPPASKNSLTSGGKKK